MRADAFLLPGGLDSYSNWYRSTVIGVVSGQLWLASEGHLYQFNGSQFIDKGAIAYTFEDKTYDYTADLNSWRSGKRYLFDHNGKPTLIMSRHRTLSGAPYSPYLFLEFDSASNAFTRTMATSDSFKLNCFGKYNNCVGQGLGQAIQVDATHVLFVSNATTSFRSNLKGYVAFLHQLNLDTGLMQPLGEIESKSGLVNLFKVGSRYFNFNEKLVPAPFAAELNEIVFNQYMGNPTVYYRSTQLLNHLGKVYASWGYGHNFDGRWDAIEPYSINRATQKTYRKQVSPSIGAEQLLSQKYLGDEIYLNKSSLISSQYGYTYNLNDDLSNLVLSKDKPENVSLIPFQFNDFRDGVDSYSAGQHGYDGSYKLDLLKNNSISKSLIVNKSGLEVASFDDLLLVVGNSSNNGEGFSVAAYDIDGNILSNTPLSIYVDSASTTYLRSTVNKNKHVAFGWGRKLAVADYQGDFVPPEVSIENIDVTTSPNETVVVTWSASDNLDQLVSLQLFKVVDETATLIQTFTDTSITSYSYQVVEGAGESLSFTIVAEDLSGRKGVASTNSAAVTNPIVIDSFSVNKSKVEPGSNLIFSWTLENASTNTPLSIQYRLVGGSAWNELGSATTSQSAAIIQANLADGEYEFRLVSGNVSKLVQGSVVVGTPDIEQPEALTISLDKSSINTSVLANEQVTLPVAVTYSKDDDSLLQSSWSASCSSGVETGVFITSGINVASWTAPSLSVDSTCTLSVVISERNGELTSQDSVQINVAKAIQNYVLTVSPATNGNVTSSPSGIDCGANADCIESFVEGTSVTLTATPDTGYEVGDWTGACSGTIGSTCTLDMSAEKTVGISFNAQIEYATLTAILPENGSLKSNPVGIDCGTSNDCTEDFEKDTTVTITAETLEGYELDSWSGACTGVTGNTCVIEMTEDKSISASFKAIIQTPDVVFTLGSSLDIGVGVSQQVNLVFDSGSNEVAAFDISMIFDPSKVLIEKVELSSEFQPLENTITNGLAILSAGVNFSSPNVSGNVQVATVTLKGVEKGTTTLQLQDIEASAAGSIYNSVGNSLEINVVENVLKGKVSYPGSVGLDGRLAPLSLVIADPVTQEIQTETTVNPDENGEFTLAGVPSGSFLALVKNSHSLSRMLSVTPETIGNIITFESFCEGDASNDDRVSSADFAILKNTYRLKRSDLNFDARADFNGDGSIKSSDFSLMKSCYRLKGEGRDIWLAREQQAKPEIETNVAKRAFKLVQKTGDAIQETPADFVFTPSVTNVAVKGDRVFISIGIKAGEGVVVDALDLFIETDPSILKLDSAQDVSRFSQKLSPLNVDSANSSLDASWGSLSGGETGDIELLEIEYIYVGNPGTSATIVVTNDSEISGTKDGELADLTGVLGTATVSLAAAPDLPPTIIVPDDLTVEAEGQETPVTQNQLGTPTITDDVDTGLTATYSPIGPFTVGTHVITWRVTDSANNTTTAEQILSVEDTVAPQIDTPNNISVQATGVNTSVTLTAPPASDVVDPNPSVTPDITGPFTIGSHNVIWTAIDASGNTASVTQVVTVTDPGAPTLSAPANITKEATGLSTPVNLGSVTGSDVIDGVLTATVDLPGPFIVGVHTVTWTVTNSRNSSTSVTQIITITDTTDPTIVAPGDKTIEATAELTSVNLGNATGTDIADASVTVSADITGPFAVGSHTITWTAEDDAGNSSTATQNITVTDTTAPAITVPPSKTVQATGANTNVDVGTASALDLVDGGVEVTSDSTGVFSVGTHTVTWTATDTHGNTSTAIQLITVSDSDGPSITAPANQTVEATATLTPVQLGTATASDNVDGILTVTPDQTGPFALGSHTIIWSAIDSAGNTSTATQTIVVEDTTAPAIQAPANVSIAATGQLTDVTLGTPVVSDLVDSNPNISVDQTGPFGVGSHVITWTVVDASGNSATATQSVVVTDSGGPTIVAPANISKEATGALTEVSLGVATASDLVDGILTATANNTGPYTVGIHTISWSVTDSAGNTSTASQIVTITDTTPPIIQVPDPVTVPATGEITQVDVGAATATDLVDGNVVVTSNSSGSFAVGTHSVVWTAIDSNGNTATATQVVTVTDGEEPEITAPADITVEATGVTTSVTLGNAIATDSVDGDLTATANIEGPFTVGTHTVIWTATDSAGNVATVSQTVTVVDTTAPVILLDSTTLQLNATGVLTVVSDYGVVASDLVDENVSLTGFVIVDENEQPLSESGLVSGVHQLLWRATDTSGNTVTTQQIIEITPQVNFVSAQAAGAGDVVTVGVVLSGDAVSYPVRIPYSIDTQLSTVANDGSDHDASGGEILIESGTTGSFTFTVAANPVLSGTGQGDLVFTMGQLENAVLGTSPTHKVTISVVNLAPVVDIEITQDSTRVTRVARDAGNIVILANASDSSVQSLSYDWSQSDSALLDLSIDNNDATFEIDPSSLANGTYTVIVAVRDNGSPLEETTISRLFKIVAGAVVVTDSDGDGVEDSEDINLATNRLSGDNSGNNSHVLESEAGTTLRLGSVALAQESTSASIVIDGLPPIPSEFTPVANISDFVIIGVAPGESSYIVLPQNTAIPTNATYLKTDSSTWRAFVEDANNSISSAPGTSNGVCPIVRDSSYTSGLTEGYFCIQLEIQDGGDNDTDGLVNGQVADPGVVVAPKVVVTSPSSTGRGGGAMPWFFVLFFLLITLVRCRDRI